SLPACSGNFAKSNYSRTYELFSRNPSYSRTYATPWGGGSPSCTNDHSRICNHPFAKFFRCVSYVKTGGTPPGHTNSPDRPSPFLYLINLLYLFFLFLHSPLI